MPALVEKLLQECDSDIREFMLAASTVAIHTGENPTYYFNWQLLQNPVQAILDWQRMRDQRPTKKI